ncbi:type II secretion system protein N [Legionella sp. km772]|uniref:type II secretion system protein N n=1 Tax=Legionella sp. km772 TaxID=2498111 RepID=UPI000F8DB147|nr:type II secretion system protein N [Legionella sp. km772]RUR13262.1 general secretion pathway protein GspC [Legionella sp. km772]
MKLDLAYFLSAKHARWLIISLISLFSLLTLAEFSKLFWTSETPGLASTNEQIIRQAPKNSLDALLHSSLFGVYVSNDLNSNNVKKSMLNITLVGILLGNTSENSQVIIRLANGEEKNYKVDDKIPGGALIKKIMLGGILVEHNGNLESVSLPKTELIFEPIAKPLRNED